MNSYDELTVEKQQKVDQIIADMKKAIDYLQFKINDEIAYMNECLHDHYEYAKKHDVQSLFRREQEALERVQRYQRHILVALNEVTENSFPYL